MENNFNEEQLRTMAVMAPLMEALLKFLNEAADVDTPRMTKIFIDKDNVGLHLWVSHKYHSIFDRIEALVAINNAQKKLLLQASEIIEANGREEHALLLADIRHRLDQF